MLKPSYDHKIIFNIAELRAKNSHRCDPIVFVHMGTGNAKILHVKCR